MRRRLFWTIAGVAAVTGLLVLAGSVVASQRVAVDATYREMKQSSDEAVAIIQEAVARASQRPGAAQELFRLIEDEQLAPLLGRFRRTAGGTEIAFALVTEEGGMRGGDDLFSRIDLDPAVLGEDRSQFTRSDSGELVVVTPGELRVRNTEATLLVGLVREAPVVRVGDQLRGLFLIVIGILLLSAFLARILSTQLTRRLEPLASASRQLADGDMSVRVPNLGDPELDEVAEAFNDMAVELEATQEREREFILGVGHDLRTPLTTIGGYAEALEGGETTQEDIERIGTVLGVQSRQLGRLIEDLSTLARLQQPQFDLRTESVDVGAHVEEVVEGFRRQAAEAGVRLSVEADRGLLMDTDPDRLGQIAQNLVENALRFTPEPGRVSVGVHREDSIIRLAVSDTGTGIAHEDLPHVFDRHYVGKQREIRRAGSGLGLSIVKGLVDRMGGRVEAESELGKGTTITVSFRI